MHTTPSPWTIAAAIVIFLIALAGLALGATWDSALIFAIGGLGAVLLAVFPRMQDQHAEIEMVLPSAIPAELQDFLDALFDPVLLVTDGRVVAANRAATSLLGRHIIDEDIRTAIRHPAAAEHLANARRQLPDRGIELVGLGNRDQRWLMRVAPARGGMLLVHLIDRSMAHAAERMRVDFVANASHELRTPLAAILGFIETLGDEEAGGDAETRNRFLGVMMNEARRMQGLVDDLISLSRIEADKHRAPDDAVDLAGLIGEVNRVIHDSPGGKDRALLVEIEPDVPAVAGDRSQLSQLLHNVIGNAVKYGRPGSPIRISMVRTGENMVRLAVQDEGDGINPQHLPRLTERFYRVDSGRSRAMGGTGLGLSIVKHIVERHRGRLDIASIPGTGTTVSVTLPAAA